MLHKKYIILIDYLHTDDICVSNSILEYIKSRYQCTDKLPKSELQWIEATNFVTDKIACIFPRKTQEDVLYKLSQSIWQHSKSFTACNIVIFITGHGRPGDNNNIYSNYEGNQPPIRNIYQISNDVRKIISFCPNIMQFPGPSIKLLICYAGRSKNFCDSHKVYRKSLMHKKINYGLPKIFNNNLPYHSFAYLLSQCLLQYIRSFSLTARLTAMKASVINHRAIIQSHSEEDTCKLLTSIKYYEIYKGQLLKIIDQDLLNLFTSISYSFICELDSTTKSIPPKINIINDPRNIHQILSSEDYCTLVVNSLEKKIALFRQYIFKNISPIDRYSVSSSLPYITNNWKNLFLPYLAYCLHTKKHIESKNEFDLVTGQKIIWTAKNGKLSLKYQSPKGTP